MSGPMRPLDRLRSSFQGWREQDELRDLYDRLRLHADEAGDRLLDLAARAAERAVADAGAEEAPLALRRPVLELAYDLLAEEGAFVVPEADLDRLDLAEIWKLKSLLRRQLAFYDQPARVAHLERAVVALLVVLFEALPPGGLTGDDDEETGLGLAVPLHALLRDPARVLDGLLAITLDEELAAAGHLETLRARLVHNVYRASGIDPERAQESRRQLVWPSQAKDKSSEALVAGYLAGTPLAACLAAPVPFAIPFAARFEHTHILGGTGHGKTQLLQHLILRDLAALQEGKGSLVVIDSQGDMIRTILQLAELAPGREGGLADRLVLIDPNDIEHPPALNLFDVGLERLDRYAPLEREKLINGAIALYEYMFGALLGAELTQRQGVIFRYLARLMLVVPGATIHTLRGFMEEPETVRDHLGGLEPMARHFFERQFLSSAFDDTRQQILTRLWGVLANPVLARMLSHERNRLDLFQALNRGSLILINTAKDLLKQEGCEILGRFFIALDRPGDAGAGRHPGRSAPRHLRLYRRGPGLFRRERRAAPQPGPEVQGRARPGAPEPRPARPRAPGLDHGLDRDQDRRRRLGP